MVKRNVVFVTGFILLLTFFVAGCGEDPHEREIRGAIAQPVFETPDEEQAYVDSINGLRYHKNIWMVENTNSPLKEDERDTFTGLDYYPVDTELVFRTRLYKYSDPEVITIGTTTGDFREAIRYGYFDFSIDGQEVRLHTYKFTRHKGTDLEKYLFIPFKDATSGTETYHGGRYLDVTEEIPGVVLIDFNDAYNPYCVYNEMYSCPIPPGENQIQVAIRAGERMYVQ